MKERTLVIYEKEEDYAARLSGYLNRDPEFPYRVAVFTNPESLSNYLEQSYADVLLLGEECAYEASGVGRRILLTEQHRDELEEPWIFKYQSAGNIMREIVAYTAPADSRDEQGGPRIYTVFATRAGQERSEYARQLVQELKSQGEVLYVNMDLFPPEGKSSTGEWKGMSEVIYYLKQGGERMRFKIRGVIGEYNGIRQLQPVHCSMDLMELTPEDVAVLFQVFREMQEFDHIVLEVGFYNEAMLEICRFSQVIYLVTPAGSDYADSTEYFIGQLALMQYGGMERKVEIVRYGGGTGKKTAAASAASGEVGFFQRMERRHDPGGD